MGIKSSSNSCAGVVEKYVGSAYDEVKCVADSIDEVCCNADNMPNVNCVADNMDDINVAACAAPIANDAAERAEASASCAAISETNAATSAACAAVSEEVASSAQSAVVANATIASDAADAALVSQTAAASSATTAECSRDDAVTAEASATNSATTACSLKDATELSQSCAACSQLCAAAREATVDACSTKVVGCSAQVTSDTACALKYCKCAHSSQTLATSSANSAASSEVNACSSKDSAAASQVAASASEVAACASKDAAASSEYCAICSQNCAEEDRAIVASCTEQVIDCATQVTADTASATASCFSAAASATAACASKDAASVSEGSATASCNSAATSATNATASETAALASETAANTSQACALCSQNCAAADEIAAEEHRVCAFKFSTCAEAEKDAACASKDAAAASATSASASETSATASCVSAAASSASSATSETNAATSATTATNCANVAIDKAACATTACACAISEANRAETYANALSTGVVAKGPWDASAGNFPTTPVDTTVVESYRITVAGTMNTGGPTGQTDILADVNDLIYWAPADLVWFHIRVNDVMSPTSILDALLTVDGVGSGLDADLLDGNSAAYFVDRSNNQNIGGIKIFDTQVRIGDVTDVANTSVDNLIVEAGAYISSVAGGSIAYFGAVDADTDDYTTRLEMDTTTHDWNLIEVTGSMPTLSVGGNNVWHAGNDGAGSGLDADLFNGVAYACFARIDIGEIITGDWTYCSRPKFVQAADMHIGSSTCPLDYYVNFPSGTGGWAQHTRMVNNCSCETPFHQGIHGSDESYTYAYMGFGAYNGSNVFRLYPDGCLTIGANRIYHAGNMGAGSDLDADLLDGQEGSYYSGLSATACSCGVSGKTAAANAQTTADAAVPKTWVTNSVESTNITCPAALASVKTAYDKGVAACSCAVSVATTANAALPASSYTAADVLTKIKTVDGDSSGLDADLLDGEHGSYYGTATAVSTAQSKAEAACTCAINCGNTAKSCAAAAQTVADAALPKASVVNSVTSTSTICPAAADAVKCAYDLASAAYPKTGGTITGYTIMDNASSNPLTLRRTSQTGIEFCMGAVVRYVGYDVNGCFRAGGNVNHACNGLVWTDDNAPKNSAINSTSTNNIATSSAVKCAYDRGSSALTCAQAALPKSGGTVTGALEINQNNNTFLNIASGVDNAHAGVLMSETATCQHGARVYYDGVENQFRLDTFATGGANVNAMYIARGSTSVNFTGAVYASGDQRVYATNYHPNADCLTTARTISLTGDATGSTTFNGSANASISVVVANDSHTHENCYYNKTLSDGRYVRKDSDTGSAQIPTGTEAQRGTGAAGNFRFNSDLASFEGHNGTEWGAIGGGGGYDPTTLDDVVIGSGTVPMYYGVVLGKEAAGSYGGSGEYRSIAIGYQAAKFGIHTDSVAIGNNAGFCSQYDYAVAIGKCAGQCKQYACGVHVGIGAGCLCPLYSAVGIGTNAGSTKQGGCSVAIGHTAGTTTQGAGSIAIGQAAGSLNQAACGIGIGHSAGRTNQLPFAVGVGYFAGYYGQATGAVAMGRMAGCCNQGAQAVSLGECAGKFNQGANSVAIGHMAGTTCQGAGAIHISATGAAKTIPTNDIVVESPNGWMCFDDSAGKWCASHEIATAVSPDSHSHLDSDEWDLILWVSESPNGANNFYVNHVVHDNGLIPWERYNSGQTNEGLALTPSPSGFMYHMLITVSNSQGTSNDEGWADIVLWPAGEVDYAYITTIWFPKGSKQGTVEMFWEGTDYQGTLPSLITFEDTDVFNMGPASANRPSIVKMKLRPAP